MSGAPEQSADCRGAPPDHANTTLLLTEVRDWFDCPDSPADAADEAVLVITVDATGFPRIAQLSRWEIVLSDSNEIALATWVASSTAANLWMNRSCVLYFFVADSWYSLRVVLHSKKSIYAGEGTAFAAFRGCVIEARRDSVPYATSTTGVGFELRDPGSALKTWSRVRAELQCVIRNANEENRSCQCSNEEG